MKIFQTESFKINVEPLFFAVLAIIFLSGYIVEYMIIFISVFLHELGHILLASLFGCRIYTLTILPVGLCASMQRVDNSRIHAILVYAGGPLVNLGIFLTGLWFQENNAPATGFIKFITDSNACLAAFNLIPLLPMDGGKILREVFSVFFGSTAARIHMRRISMTLSAGFVVVGAFLFHSDINGLSLILIGVYAMFTLKSEEAEAAIMNVRNVLYRKSRLLKKGMYPARDIAVLGTTRLGDIIKNLDFDRFHFIYVLSNELKLVRVLTEQELMDAMLRFNSEMTFEEFLAADGEKEA